MKRILCLCLLTSCATLPTHQPGSAMVLTDGTYSARMVQLKNSDWVIQIAGTDGPLDEVVARYHVDDANYSSNVVAYETDYNGREISPLQKKTAGKKIWWSLFTLNHKRPMVSVEMDEAASQTLDVEALLRTYVQHRDDGTITEFARFDREATITRHKAQLAEKRSRATDCGAVIDLSVDWSTFPDETLTNTNIHSRCMVPVTALDRLCNAAVFRDAVARDLRRVECVLAPAQAIAFADGVLQWGAAERLDMAAEFVGNYLLDDARWPAVDGAMRRHVDIGRATLCGDGKNYVGFMRHRTAEDHYLFFGDGKSLRRVRPPEKTYMDRKAFFEPRYFNPKLRVTDDGVDHRYHSELEEDCRLFCGPRLIELKEVGDDDKRKLLTNTPIEPVLAIRRPHGLARDRGGIYYFVDVGHDPGSKDFRVFVGRKGNLRELKMINLVTDSEGQIFETDRGKLRLVIEKEKSFWIAGRKKTDLTNLPLEDNWKVIYDELGVYVGQPFGTPCDLF